MHSPFQSWLCASPRLRTRGAGFVGTRRDTHQPCLVAALSHQNLPNCIKTCDCQEARSQRSSAFDCRLCTTERRVDERVALAETRERRCGASRRARPARWSSRTVGVGRGKVDARGRVRTYAGDGVRRLTAYLFCSFRKSSIGKKK